eukprot:COSAG02_NODE_1098_length_14587_cov_9.462590_7_plen_195_part_00
MLSVLRLVLRPCVRRNLVMARWAVARQAEQRFAYSVCHWCCLNALSPPSPPSPSPPAAVAPSLDPVLAAPHDTALVCPVCRRPGSGTAPSQRPCPPLLRCPSQMFRRKQSVCGTTAPRCRDGGLAGSVESAGARTVAPNNLSARAPATAHSSDKHTRCSAVSLPQPTTASVLPQGRAPLPPDEAGTQRSLRATQ